jgi:hypothetical protein
MHEIDIFLGLKLGVAGSQVGHLRTSQRYNNPQGIAGWLYRFKENTGGF